MRTHFVVPPYFIFEKYISKIIYFNYKICNIYIKKGYLRFGMI